MAGFSPNISHDGLVVSGQIKSYQTCPGCGASFQPSKGETPIKCPDCKTSPTKYYISIWWRSQDRKVYRDRSGRSLDSWGIAHETLTEIRAAIRRKTFDHADYSEKAVTFGTYFQSFLRGYTQGSVSTLEKLKSCGKHFESLAGLNIKDIIGLNIKEWWFDLRDKNLSPKYCNDCLQWLKKVFHQAVEEQLLREPPRFPVKPLVVPKKTIRWLSQEDQVRALLHIPEKDQPIYSFLFLTGCRVMEAAALHWEDIDWKRETITIRRSVDRHSLLSETKTKSERILPLVGEIKSLLEELRSGPVIPISGSVFRFRSNRYSRQNRRETEYYIYDYLQSTWHQACQSAGLERIELKNATRHSFGMQRVGQFDIWLLAKVMGHTDIKTTENYIQAQAGHLRALFGPLDKPSTNQPATPRKAKK